MNELQLKYGCNPNQKPSRIYMNDGSELPLSMFPRQALLWDFLLQRHWQRSTGWTT